MWVSEKLILFKQRVSIILQKLWVDSHLSPLLVHLHLLTDPTLSVPLSPSLPRSISPSVSLSLPSSLPLPHDPVRSEFLLSDTHMLVRSGVRLSVRVCVCVCVCVCVRLLFNSARSKGVLSFTVSHGQREITIGRQYSSDLDSP